MQLTEITTITATKPASENTDTVIYSLCPPHNGNNHATLVMTHISVNDEETYCWAKAFDVRPTTYKSLLTKIGKQTPLDSDMGRQIDRLCTRAQKESLYARTVRADSPPDNMLDADTVTKLAITRLDEIRDSITQSIAPKVTWQKYQVNIENISIRPDTKHDGYAKVALPAANMKTLFLSIPSQGLKYGTRSKITLDRHTTYHIWGYDNDGNRMFADVGADSIAQIIDSQEVA